MEFTMEQLVAIRAWIMNRINVLAAYAAVFYFLEIIFLMFSLLFLYGKAVSLGAGAVLSPLLAYHVIQLYYRKRIHRTIQLWAIDIHAAFAAGYLFYCAAGGPGSDPGTPFNDRGQGPYPRVRASPPLLPLRERGGGDLPVA